MRKPPINPTAPMKPLYWTRILIAQAPPTSLPTTPVRVPSPDEPDAPAIIPANPLWSQLDEVKLECNFNEFVDLFSRQVTTCKPSKKKTETKTKKSEVIKLLDGKRSQSVGILAHSLHVDFQEIENAVYNFDTSVVNLESLQIIYENVSISVKKVSNDSFEGYIITFSSAQLRKSWSWSKITSLRNPRFRWISPSSFYTTLARYPVSPSGFRVLCSWPSLTTPLQRLSIHWAT